MAPTGCGTFRKNIQTNPLSLNNSIKMAIVAFVNYNISLFY